LTLDARSPLNRQAIEQCLRERAGDDAHGGRDDRAPELVDGYARDDTGDRLCREPTKGNDAERVSDRDDRAGRQQSAGGRRGLQQSGVERFQCAATGIDSRVMRRRNTQ
jgi:hypothetical protein